LNEIDLAVVMVSYNTKELLKRSLKSIYQNVKGISFEIIVVDNGSSDNSVKMIRKESPQVKLIENQENLGFARANNQAIKQSRARYFLLFNPDTSFRANSPHEMIKFMDNHPQVGILGCRILNTDGTIQPSNASFPNLFTEFLRVFQLKKLIPGVRARGKIGQKWSRILGSWMRISLCTMKMLIGAIECERKIGRPIIFLSLRWFIMLAKVIVDLAPGLLLNDTKVCIII